MATRSASIRASSSASSSSSAWIRCANEDSDALVAAVTGSEIASVAAGPFGDEGRHGEALHSATELLWGAVAEVAHLDERLGPGLAGRALGHDEDPDGLDGAVSGLGACLSPDH